MAYIPEKEQVALVSLTLERQDDYSTRELTLSIFDLKTQNWKSHEKIKLAETLKNVDKPWFFWDTLEHKGYLTFHIYGVPILYMCDQSLKFRLVHILTIPEQSAGHGSPLAFPSGNGVEFIFIAADDDHNPIRVEHIVYDPVSRRASKLENIFPSISPNPLNKRLHMEQLDNNLSGLVTPQRGICLTSATDEKILVGYKPYNQPAWQILEIPITDRDTGKVLYDPKSINPQVVGPRTLAVTFLAKRVDKYNENFAYSFLLDEGESGLTPRDGSSIHGPYPCAPYPEQVELGDYSQVQKVGKEIAFISLLNHNLQVKIISQS